LIQLIDKLRPTFINIIRKQFIAEITKLSTAFKGKYQLFIYATELIYSVIKNSPNWLHNLKKITFMEA
jgi:hypothetical protein